MLEKTEGHRKEFLFIPSMNVDDLNSTLKYVSDSFVHNRGRWGALVRENGRLDRV